jgi:hypothetical protein
MQTILVTIAIALAAFYLMRQLYKQFIKKDDSCSGCGMGKA